jgi:hypothetical protein
MGADLLMSFRLVPCFIANLSQNYPKLPPIINQHKDQHEDQEHEEGNCHFLRLPAELRNKIYTEYLLPHDGYAKRVTISPRVSGRTNMPFPVTRVSRQIRTDCLKLLYSSLELDVRSDELRYVRHWINVVPEEALNAIRWFRYSGVYYHCRHFGRAAASAYLDKRMMQAVIGDAEQPDGVRAEISPMCDVSCVCGLRSKWPETCRTVERLLRENVEEGEEVKVKLTKAGLIAVVEFPWRMELEGMEMEERRSVVDMGGFEECVARN